MRRRVRALALVAVLLLACSSLCVVFAQDDEPSKPAAAEQPAGAGETDAADRPKKPAEAPVADKDAGKSDGSGEGGA